MYFINSVFHTVFINLCHLLYTLKLLQNIESATDMYDSANENYDTMNQARRNAVNARVEAYEAVGMSYYDDYDYTYAGNYYSSTNDTVTDVGWVIPVVVVGGAAIAKAGPAVAAKIGSMLTPVAPKALEISDKIMGQMSKRGWTVELINQTVNNSTITREAINKATNNPATAYYTKEGAYVVVDNVLRTVVQISNRLDPATWIPDPTIINPYIP